MRAPRCGKPMFQHKAANVYRYEATNGPMLEEPVCARPEGHNGPCRSGFAVARNYRADVRRQPGALQACGCGCGEMTSWGRYKRGHNRDGIGRWAAA
jgi:hypothetical protein